MRIRELTLAIMLASATVIACENVAGPSELALGGSSDGAGLPEPCAEWTCNEETCGGPTSPPYHACCVRSVYADPYSYESPGPTAEEPTCSGGACEDADNQCEWEDDVPGHGWCNLITNSICPTTCDPEDPCMQDLDWDDCDSHAGWYSSGLQRASMIAACEGA
jgi:hypothetical protein